jgi:hypothetical protein
MVARWSLLYAGSVKVPKGMVVSVANRAGRVESWVGAASVVVQLLKIARRNSFLVRSAETLAKATKSFGPKYRALISA